MIPVGKEDYPVIFVNRDDVEAYTRWLTQITGRIHRIPTPIEFEIAARGGNKNSNRYFCGNSEELLTPENINFNKNEDRKYDQWKVYLKPSKWGIKNDIGLYQMAGNVWQFVTQNEDPTLAPWMYRIEKLLDLERLIMGGSWMSTKDYLACGKTVNQSPGIRCPDLGIRLVREPEGANWGVKNRKDIAKHDNIFGSASNAPFNVWDMNGDGKDEVTTLLQIDDENYVAILNGMSGKLMKKTLWDKMATDFSLSSTRIQMSVAYLDGKNPVIITQTGIYENEKISAYDKNLNKIWTYRSFMETSGSGGHKVEIADVDNDGKQEVIYGTTCLNTDGTFRWSIYRRHPDIISIHDYIPERSGLEICYIVESSAHAGIYMVDASNGDVIWKNNHEDDPVWSHGHTGWTADIWTGSPGMECMTNRAGHYDKSYLLFSSDGKRLSEKFPVGFTPIEWDGDTTRELIGENGKIVGNFNGTEIILVPGESPNPVPNSSIQFTADLCGDFRSEIVINGVDTDGRPAIMVITAPKSIDKRYVTPSRDIDYKLWLARNKGGGYGSVYDYILKDPEK